MTDILIVSLLKQGRVVGTNKPSTVYALSRLIISIAH